MSKPLCKKCKVRSVQAKGKGILRNICYKCQTKSPDALYKKTYCEACRFVALNSCQLDVDHIDGNRSNNSPDNYQTLCANCHRLKSLLNKDL